MASNKEADTVKSMNASLQQQVTELENGNKRLHEGLKEIYASLKDQNGQPNVTVECPTLEKLLSVSFHSF